VEFREKTVGSKRQKKFGQLEFISKSQELFTFYNKLCVVYDHKGIQTVSLVKEIPIFQMQDKSGYSS
jgi:hypothetical protein